MDDSLQDRNELLGWFDHPNQIYYCWCIHIDPPYNINQINKLTHEDLVLLASVPISSDDFRQRLEYYITHFWILKNRIKIIPPVVHTDKLSKRSPRESCEFFTNQSSCLLHGEPCNKDYCSDYLKNGGLPLKRLPTDEKTVDFNDTVNILSEDGRQFKIVIPAYVDQRNMKPVEKAMVHHKVGETVQLGPDMATYKICSIEKCQPHRKAKRKPTCLLSPWTKLRLKQEDLEYERDMLYFPDKPSDLTDSAAITEWARCVQKVVARHEELERQVEEYEDWLNLNWDEP